MSDIKWLFKTSAVKIAPANQQFWYTSGLIGPYYINTEYVCGGKATALLVLALIDERAEATSTFAKVLVDKLTEIYNRDSNYKELIDELSGKIAALAKEKNITYVSGGQRRDWFFSPMIAEKIGFPCLYIYNDKRVFDQKGKAVTNLNGAKVINVADLLTAGSSYTEKWVPALKAVNAVLIASANVVDRAQGGKLSIEAAGVKDNLTIFTINQSFFDLALEYKCIDADQYKILANYFNNQDEAMRNWLKENPAFLENALNSADPKTRSRAKNLVEKDLYKLR